MLKIEKYNKTIEKCFENKQEHSCEKRFKIKLGRMFLITLYLNIDYLLFKKNIYKNEWICIIIQNTLDNYKWTIR